MTYSLHYEPEDTTIWVESVANPDPEDRDFDYGLLPSYSTMDAAGADLKSSVDMVIPARSRALVPTGIRIAIREGFAGFVHPRSGLALKYGITVLNTPGTIDSDYRGELKVILINHSDEDFAISKYDRIAQLIIQRVEHASFTQAWSPLGKTGRGEGGFGSTGVQ